MSRKDEGTNLLGDYWELFEGGVVRHHCTSRVTIFSPDSKHLLKTCPIAVDNLQDVRLTISSISPYLSFHDKWRNPLQCHTHISKNRQG